MKKENIIINLMILEEEIKLTNDEGEKIKLKKQWTKLHNKLIKILKKEVKGYEEKE